MDYAGAGFESTMRTIFFALVVAFLLGTGLAAEHSGDIKALEGVWVPIKAELGGQPMPESVLKTITLRIKEREYEVIVKGEPEPDRGTWSLDSAAKPKAMTVSSLKGPNAGKIFPAIYELRDRKLTVCYDLSGVKRPTAFKSMSGTQLYLVTYSRRPE